MDTLGPEKWFVIQRFPLFRGYLICIAIYLDPRKQSVMERFPLLREFVVRGSSCIRINVWLSSNIEKMYHSKCMQ